MAVVVASDLSPRCRGALMRSVAIARATGQNLHLVHVVDRHLPPPAHAAVVEGARSLLSHAAKEAGADAPHVEIEILIGQPKTEVARYAYDVGASLLVLGRHDTGKDGAFSFAETTASHIARSSPLPTLLVISESAAPYAHAIVGVDFSIYGKAAVRHAHKIAADAALTLVHAYQVPFRISLGSAEYMAELRESARQAFDRYLNDEMTHLIGRLSHSGVAPSRIDHEVAAGTAYEVLVEAVRRHGADLLAVGTHGAGGVTRAVWGSVATALLEDPPCDLLIAHAM